MGEVLKNRRPRDLFIEELFYSVAEFNSRHAERDPRLKHCGDDDGENPKSRRPRDLFIEDLLYSVVEFNSRHAERDPRLKDLRGRRWGGQKQSSSS